MSVSLKRRAPDEQQASPDAKKKPRIECATESSSTAKKNSTVVSFLLQYVQQCLRSFFYDDILSIILSYWRNMRMEVVRYIVRDNLPKGPKGSAIVSQVLIHDSELYVMQHLLTEPVSIAVFQIDTGKLLRKFLFQQEFPFQETRGNMAIDGHELFLAQDNKIIVCNKDTTEVIRTLEPSVAVQGEEEEGTRYQLTEHIDDMVVLDQSSLLLVIQEKDNRFVTVDRKSGNLCSTHLVPSGWLDDASCPVKKSDLEKEQSEDYGLIIIDVRFDATQKILYWKSQDDQYGDYRQSVWVLPIQELQMDDDHDDVKDERSDGKKSRRKKNTIKRTDASDAMTLQRFCLPCPHTPECDSYAEEHGNGFLNGCGGMLSTFAINGSELLLFDGTPSTPQQRLVAVKDIPSRTQSNLLTLPAGHNPCEVCVNPQTGQLFMIEKTEARISVFE